jgi:FPC/CPF motif-containing protein YcgG
MLCTLGNEHLPCFAGKSQRIIKELRARFMPSMSDQQAVEAVHNLIDRSMDNWSTSCYDRYEYMSTISTFLVQPLQIFMDLMYRYQRCCVGIL